MSAAWCPGSMRLCGIALLLGACGPSALTVSLAGPGPINRGLPFHVLVRSVSIQEFRSESYAAVSRLVSQPDPSVLRAEVVASSQSPYRASFTVPAPAGAKQGLGVYCLFSDPRGRWRVFLERPLPSRLAITLAESSIAGTQASGKLATKAPELKPPELKAPELKAPEPKAPDAKGLAGKTPAAADGAP